MITLRDAAPDDTAAIVAMNAAVVDVTSPMDAERLAHLREIAAYALVAEKAGGIVGFILAIECGAPYENANFEWFSQRLRNFVYVDRIVIAAEGQGAGLGRQFYAQVANAAVARGCLLMAAEMDLEPANAQSLSFHEKLGFAELGQRRYESGKVVSMQVRGLYPGGITLP